MLEINKIYQGNCLEYINTEIEHNTIDFVLTSPPYNVDLGNNKYNKNNNLYRFHFLSFFFFGCKTDNL